MKKILTWLSKGSKIIKILQQIYKALVIANSTIETSETIVQNTGIVSEDTAQKISETKSYIEIALEYIGKIMGWFGISTEERDAFARAIETAVVKAPPAEIRNDLENIVKNG